MSVRRKMKGSKLNYWRIEKNHSELLIFLQLSRFLFSHGLLILCCIYHQFNFFFSWLVSPLTAENNLWNDVSFSECDFRKSLLRNGRGLFSQNTHVPAEGIVGRPPLPPGLHTAQLVHPPGLWLCATLHRRANPTPTFPSPRVLCYRFCFCVMNQRTGGPFLLRDLPPPPVGVLWV